eukprot:TRINITY_DN2254_c0_g1_i1.p1 TRINITY_DN2254_c0_g1~~TRINITY_DN2254_c0_g1_i1.p1  ORF type:complete len:642 (+),score=158.08 TRINITY_DN2254_c0_g1_i1:77-2002(+)
MKAVCRSYGAALLLLLLLAVSDACDVLPGAAPVEYDVGEEVMVQVVKLSSPQTGLPLDYYEALPFCAPKDLRDEGRHRLGQLLRGDRALTSLYAVHVLRAERCKVLGANMSVARWHKSEGEQLPADCTHSYTAAEIAQFVRLIKDNYRVHWELDDMPAMQPKPYLTGVRQEYDAGFLLGQHDDSGTVTLNNYVRITIKYAPHGEDKIHIVGFEVEPRSIDSSDCHSRESRQLRIAPEPVTKSITWTYSVTWEESSVSWHERWEPYRIATAPSVAEVRWLAVANSALVVFFLTGTVAAILLRALHADITSKLVTGASDEEDGAAWKQLCADVARPPPLPLLFACLVGCGTEVLASVAAALACGGFGRPLALPPAATISLLCAPAAAAGGYVAARMYGTMRKKRWWLSSSLAALLAPLLLFSLFGLMNLVIASAKSSRAVPFAALLELFLVLCATSLPLALAGGYAAKLRQPIVASGCHFERHVPRFVPPPRHWFERPTARVLLSGALPFGAVLVELLIVFCELWRGKVATGVVASLSTSDLCLFLVVVLAILIVTCAETAVVMCYFQLCAEDHRWWWCAFANGSSLALYVLCYCALFYFARLWPRAAAAATVIYVGYSLCAVLLLALMTGAVGVGACFVFVY